MSTSEVWDNSGVNWEDRYIDTIVCLFKTCCHGEGVVSPDKAYFEAWWRKQHYPYGHTVPLLRIWNQFVDVHGGTVD